MGEPTELDILLEIKTLLEKQIKQTDAVHQESHQYLERNEKRAQSAARGYTAAIVLLIVFIVMVVVLEVI